MALPDDRVYAVAVAFAEAFPDYRDKVFFAQWAAVAVQAIDDYNDAKEVESNEQEDS